LAGRGPIDERKVASAIFVLKHKTNNYFDLMVGFFLLSPATKGGFARILIFLTAAPQCKTAVKVSLYAFIDAQIFYQKA